MKEESERIREALGNDDRAVLAEYGEFNAALQRSAKLLDLPELQVTEDVSIDSFATWRASRFAVIENGFERAGEDC